MHYFPIKQTFSCKYAILESTFNIQHHIYSYFCYHMITEKLSFSNRVTRKVETGKWVYNPRHSFGVIPYLRLKTRQKWGTSLNPLS